MTANETDAVKIGRKGTAHKLKPDALVEMNPVSEIKQLGREQNKARD